MRRIVAVSVLTLLLSACLGPPRPTFYPYFSDEENSSNVFLNSAKPKLPKNQYERGNWTRELYISGSDFSNAENFAQIWYFAHHADQIDISGEQNAIALLKNEFVRGGATATVNLNVTCVSGPTAVCPDVSTVVFRNGRGDKAGQ